MEQFLSIILFGGVFLSIYSNWLDRRFAMLAGGIAMAILGGIMGFYSIEMVVSAIYFETLALIFGMSMISAVLARSGIFSVLAEKIAVYGHGDGWLIFVLFVFATYTFSLTVNNLAAMIVIVPITLTICRRIGANPIPILIGEIIASNLGGASTMVGDFPNMIISAAAHLHFLDFISGMMTPCLILLAVMLLYFQRHKSKFQASKLQPIQTPLPKHNVDSYLLRLGSLTLVAVLVGFLIAQWVGLRPGLIALIAGFLMLELGKFAKHELFFACSLGDIIFFAGLFVLVGGLNAAGIMNVFHDIIQQAGNGNHLLELLIFMWMAAIITIFLNAGPATAFFIPIAMELYQTTADITVWWALSLGVLAGSSAALTGATAGSIAVSQLDEYSLRYPDMKPAIKPASGLDFKEYMRWGMPIMLLFLVCSSVFIAIIIL